MALFEMSKIGVRLEVFPSASVNTSSNVMPVKVTFPLFSTVIV